MVHYLNFVRASYGISRTMTQYVPIIKKAVVVSSCLALIYQYYTEMIGPPGGDTSYKIKKIWEDPNNGKKNCILVFESTWKWCGKFKMGSLKWRSCKAGAIMVFIACMLD